MVANPKAEFNIPTLDEIKAAWARSWEPRKLEERVGRAVDQIERIAAELNVRYGCGPAVDLTDCALSDMRGVQNVLKALRELRQPAPDPAGVA